MAFYSKARQPRPSIHDPSVRPLRFAVLKAAAINFLLLQILFLGLFCYIFGSLFLETSHIHNINVLFIDYDGDAISQAVHAAYEQLRGSGFPTLVQQPAESYPQPDDISHSVCNIDYWAALYIAPHASKTLTAALKESSAASSYNKSYVLTMVWNEARYPTVVDSVVHDSLKVLSETARSAYIQLGGKELIQTLNVSDPAAIAIFSDPWSLTSIDLQPTSQGSRLIYNTLVIILIIIQEFFFLGYVNGLYERFKLYTAVSPHRIGTVRQIISGAYTFVGSLCTAGAIWAFRDGWNVNGYQFLLTWMALWLFAHLNFLVFDVFTIWLYPPFVPMALISWVVLSISSILLPFELSPGFYKWGYALPAHSIFQVLIDIWSGGCNPQLSYALPVMFTYEILGLTLSSIGVYRRAHYASIKQEWDEKSFKERIQQTLSDRRDASLGTVSSAEDVQESQKSTPEQAEPVTTQRRGIQTGFDDQEELVNAIRLEVSRQRTAQSFSSRSNRGPCFDLAY